MTRIRAAALALFLLCSLAANARAAEPSVVVLLSWDGTRWDYPARAATVALARMARDGAHARRLTPVFPSSTFPNHVSLATGTYPDRHGIIENSFTDRQGRRFSYGNDASFIEAEPLWAAAERQGVRAAVFFWAGSETDWHGRGATYRRAPFDGSVPEARKVDQILAWLDLPAAQRPRLIMSWWHGCDGVGHELGPDAPEIAAQLLAQDRELARLFAGLDARGAWAHTAVIVASDHGMSRMDGAIDAEALLSAAGIAARLDGSGGEGQLYLKDPAQTAAALRTLSGIEGLTAYTPESLPARMRSFYPSRSGDLTLVPNPPWAVGRESLWQRLEIWWRGKSPGVHGYDPSQPDMGAIFYALGAGVPAGAELGEVRAIDVAPTVAALLGIDPPAQSEGRALFQAPQAPPGAQ
ncbi:MAG TPA: ectonucleotide pyrophosphatase/phosphodiesterase [Myxococcota bacterium]|nr:ectonucleotide pyrophosphatase/phosphodiesterase [Myxococcota bacterium]